MLLVLYFKKSGTSTACSLLKVKQQAGLALQSETTERERTAWQDGEKHVFYGAGIVTPWENVAVSSLGLEERGLLARNADCGLGVNAIDALCMAVRVSPALALLWHSMVPGARHLLARQAGAGEATAPSAQVGGNRSQQGEKAWAWPPSRCRQRGLREAEGSVPWRLSDCDLEGSPWCLRP